MDFYEGKREFPRPNPLASKSLLVAASEGNIDELHKAIKAGERIDQWDEKGQTPLHYASKYGQVEVIKFLLDKGSDANRACGYGRTPLHYASRHDQAAAAKALCSVGDIKIDAQDKVRSEVRMG
eukprot:1180045-Prorocentrum_minimum.AAC.3